MTQLLKTVGLATAMLVAVGALEAEAGGRAKTRAVMTGVLNLNTASAAQLDQLPGVGEKAATRIIEYRRKTPFTRPEELVKVKGFGKKKFEKLKGHLAVSGNTNLTVKREPLPEGPAQGRGAPPKR
jgi:competence protein ComEA